MGKRSQKKEKYLNTVKVDGMNESEDTKYEENDSEIENNSNVKKFNNNEEIKKIKTFQENFTYKIGLFLAKCCLLVLSLFSYILASMIFMSIIATVMTNVANTLDASSSSSGLFVMYQVSFMTGFVVFMLIKVNFYKIYKNILIKLSHLINRKKGKK